MNKTLRPLAALALIVMVTLISACGSSTPAQTSSGAGGGTAAGSGSGTATASSAGSVSHTSSVSHLANILTHDVNKIINLPVLSDSVRNGVAGCLYNVTIPNVDNWRRFATRYGSPAIADLYRNPLLGKKVVLNIMDGLIAEYAGGPRSQPNYAVHHATLLASKDPVAIDALAVRQIDEWRLKARFPSIIPLASHIQTAAQLGIGNADSIEVRNVHR